MQLDVQSMNIVLEKAKIFRETAKTLHSHLERLWICPKYTEHAAKLQLCHEASELYREAFPELLLDMALTYRDVDQLSLASRNLILLATESTLEGTALHGRNDKTIMRFGGSPLPEASLSIQMREQTPVEVMERPQTSWYRRALKIFGRTSTGNTRDQSWTKPTVPRKQVLSYAGENASEHRPSAHK
ncbi:hypothetical protein N7G274_005605 [Stereocaulon virgatum]|uniref:Uncharacterized protein n=1 Tax=Stereocaulon virgatum TaxID=373712 RepID=A0ABR4AAA7_9LECA